jgi:hypothetical protein
VDDSPSAFIGVPDQNNSITPIRPPRIGGKGRLIAEYAAQIGAEALFTEYQCGWLGIGRASSKRRAVRTPRGVAPS